MDGGKEERKVLEEKKINKL